MNNNFDLSMLQSKGKSVEHKFVGTLTARETKFSEGSLIIRNNHWCCSTWLLTMPSNQMFLLVRRREE